MSFGYVTIDGERVEARVAADFNRMNNEFHAITGYWLHVNSGTRTTEEQAYLYNGWINGLPGFNLAAKPGYSNHEEGGPIGPRALDLSDSGADAGVMTIGSYRSNVLVSICGKHQFKNAGHYFNPREGWHYEWTGVFAEGAYNGGTPIDIKVQREQQFLNAARGEQLEPDGIAGPLYREAVMRYQTFLRRDWGYTADIDGDWGPATQAAHARYYAWWEAQKQVTGGTPSDVPAFPLLPSQWFGPEQGGDNSISGHYGHSEDLARWQQRMKDRGWIIEVDGLYGFKGDDSTDTQTGRTAKAFQAEKGLFVDGLIGPETWKAAWTSPVTPATPNPLPPVEGPASPPVVPSEPGETPAADYVPTAQENPRNLPVVPRTYPGAKFALQAPLGDGVRGFKGDPPVAVELVVDMAIEHWTGVDQLQFDWFSYKNGRSSCPNLYILPNGDVVEFIPFEAKPALTGPEYNWRSFGWEIQKTASGEGTPEQFEAVCRILAWLASMDGKTYRGVPVRFKLDRGHFKNHGELLQTTCPGPWWTARMDAQLARAKEILESGYWSDAPTIPDTPEGPEVPEVPVESGKIEVDRTAVEELNEVARGIVAWTDEVLT